MTAEERKQIAYNYMVEGLNCCQSTVLAFKDILPVDEENLRIMTSSMGGGVGALRSACGCISGMGLVIGMLYGYDNVDKEKKAEITARVQQLGAKFVEVNGALNCGELTGLSKFNNVPAKRVDGRDCKDFVADFVAEIAAYIDANPVK